MYRTDTHMTPLRGEDRFAGFACSVFPELSTFSEKSVTGGAYLSGEIFDFLLVRLRP
jgi:hypothetical protein